MLLYVSFQGLDHPIDNVSKACRVEKFKKLVAEATNCKVEHQMLMFGGKVLANKDDLCDYQLQNNNKIMLLERKPLAPIEKNNIDQAPVEAATDAVAEASTSTNKESELSEIERKEELRKIGGEELVKQIEDEQNDAPEEPCEKCHDNEKKKCTTCGCASCGGKTPAERLLFCEECQFYWHFECLENPINDISELPDPDSDWFCDMCKNDPSSIIQAGERVKYGNKRSKMPSRMREIKRDWGRGFATAGRTKECTIVDKHHFGPIPGIEVGMSWQLRIQVSEAGIHLPPVAGIAGQAKKGCQSIILAGGYEDDEDWGDRFYYTGSGGRDLSGNKRVNVQSKDQELTGPNKAIAMNCNAKFNDVEGATSTDWKKGKPIRVCRSYKFDSEFAPKVGVRYDGIYKVVRYWPHKGKSGFIVWRYEFKRDDPSLCPWDENAKKYSCVMKKSDDDFENAKSKRKVKNAEATESAAAEDESYQIEDQYLALIKKDKVYAEKWADLIANTEKLRKDRWFQKIAEEFQCFICCELVYEPILIPCPCKLSICNACFQETIKNGFDDKCWTCRKPFGKSDSRIHTELQEILDALCPGYGASRTKVKGKRTAEEDLDEINENVVEKPPPSKKRNCRAKPKRFKTKEELDDQNSD